MYQESRIIFLYTETSFHPGSGDSIVGVDLPIQRERHTDFPKNQGGGVKGALRDMVEGSLRLEDGKIDPIVDEIFGPETNSESFQGALSSTELKILLFPVKSLKDVFAWITCPFVIARFQRDVRRLNKNYSELNDFTINSLSDTQALIPENCHLKTQSGEIILEDLVFDADAAKRAEVFALADWLARNAFSNDGVYKYWTDKLRTSLLVVSDEIFQHFVVNYTEVSTRHKRSETGTVESGQLWNEETLPPDTLMYATLLASDSHRKGSDIKKETVMKTVEDVIEELGFIQMGASETVGQGFLAINCFTPLQQNNSTINKNGSEPKSVSEPISAKITAGKEDEDDKSAS